MIIYWYSLGVNKKCGKCLWLFRVFFDIKIKVYSLVNLVDFWVYIWLGMFLRGDGK